MSDRTDSSWSTAASELLANARVSVDFVNEVSRVVDWRLDDRVLRCFHLVLITGGAGRYVIDANAYGLQKGSLVLVGPGVLHSASGDPDNSPGLQSCRFAIMKPDGSLPPAGALASGMAFEPPEPERYRVWLADARRLWLRPQSPWRDLAVGAVIARVFLAACADRDAKMNGPTRNQQVDAVVSRLVDRPAERVDLETMTAWAGMPRTRFVRAFRAATGLSPGAYLIQLRIRHARVLLRDTDITIAQVAGELGYPDPFSFSKQFRRETGVTPSEWRQLAGDYQIADGEDGSSTART